MKRFLTILVTLCMLLGVVTIPPIMAAEGDAPTFNTSTPTALYDLTNDALYSTFQNVFNMEYELNAEEGYTTFTATDNDPYTWVKSPECPCNEAAYVRAYYRTTATGLCGEFYASRSDGVAMGVSGSTFDYNLTTTGEWSTTVEECTAWSTAADDVNFDTFRIDPLQGSPCPAGASIDVKYYAFFKTQADAEAFDYDEYMKKLAYEEEQKRLEEEAAKANE